jgi:hypothetical protein
MMRQMIQMLLFFKKCGFVTRTQAGVVTDIRQCASISELDSVAYQVDIDCLSVLIAQTDSQRRAISRVPKSYHQGFTGRIADEELPRRKFGQFVRRISSGGLKCGVRPDDPQARRVDQHGRLGRLFESRVRQKQDLGRGPALLERQPQAAGKSGQR